MRYTFKAKVGVRRTVIHGDPGSVPRTQVDKFLVFLLNGRKESFLSDCRSVGLLESRGDTHSTDLAVVKVFYYCLQPGSPPMYTSIYLVLGAAGKTITITPHTTAGKETGLFFKAECRFLKPEEHAAVLDTNGTSYQIWKNTPPLAVNVLRSMIRVDRRVNPTRKPALGCRVIRRRTEQLKGE